MGWFLTGHHKRLKIVKTLLNLKLEELLEGQMQLFIGKD